MIGALKTYILIVTCLLVISCKRDTKFVINDDDKYFPVKLGASTTYEVDSLHYDDFYNPIKIDSSYYQIKEVIADTFRDNSNNLTFRVDRYKRYSDTLPWYIYNVFTINPFLNRIERTENNLRFIKMIFPVNEEITWKGNAYIHAIGNLDYMDGWDYEYVNPHIPETMNNLLFDSTITIIQQSDTSLIRKDFFLEKYAKGVGLIYKEASHLSKQNIQEPWQSGYYIRYKILNYTL